LFPDACRSWQSRATAAKTWAQFKIDFATAHREFRLTNQTAQQSGFQSANMMIAQGRDDSMHETAEAIAQLATAMSSDRGTVATLTTTNAKLANQLEAARALIAQLKSEIATLKIKINLFGKVSDRQEPQTTIVIAGPTDSKLQNRTLVPRAT
jgi:multidrug resistance efflux pump